MTGSRPALLAFAVALLAPGAVSAQANPPESHTVRPGDTLWDLARTYLGDPFLWPDIYRQNTNVVEDPHWIYPGEVLRMSGGDVASVPTQDTPIPAGAGNDSAAAEAGLAEAQVGDLSDVDQSRDSADLRALLGEGARSSNEPSLEVRLARGYRPVGRTEFYASGFLSEEQELPLGRILGAVIPSQVASIAPFSTMQVHSLVGVRPPEGAKYEVGDSLLIVRRDRQIPKYGDVIVPTGMVRITDVSHKDVIGEIVAQYGQIRTTGQYVMPVEKFADPGHVRPVAISDGVHGNVIQSRDRQELKGPLDVIFINRGRQDGVGPGDMFEVRAPVTRILDAETVDEVMATFQIVHVRDHTATARLVHVVQPNIRPGAEIRQIAKLPS